MHSPISLDAFHEQNAPRSAHTLEAGAYRFWAPLSEPIPTIPLSKTMARTIGAAVKDQLEQGRDLLRHANPSGDLGAVIARALELLIADQLKRRFGAGARHKAAPARPQPRESQTPVTPDPTAAAKPSPSHIPRAARRAVLERDGIACTWRDADGNRCASRAWLEIDHRRPRAKAGASEPENLRMLCRAHNQLAAEHEFGRAHIQRAIRTRQQRATHPTAPPIPSPPPT